MSNEVDLRELAIDRDVPDGPRLDRGRHLGSRYVLPGALLVGFAAVLLWSSWSLLFPPREVTVVPVVATQSLVQQSGTPLFQAAGWIEPRPTAVRVAALAPGVVQELLVVEDQPVAAGEPVARLVSDDAQLALNGAVAERALRQAELEQAQAALKAASTRFEQPVHLVAALNEAEAALAHVQIDLRNLPFELARSNAQRDFARMDYQGKLAAGGAIAGRAVDQAKSQMLAADAAVDGLRDRRQALEREQASLTARRDALRTQLELLADETKAKQEGAAQVKAAQAQLDRADVVLEQARLRLDRMTVRSPTAGRVYQLIGLPGTTLSGSIPKNDNTDSSTVVTLYRPEHLQARVDVRFEDVPKVQLGQGVEIKNAALSDPLTGRVLFVSSEADIQKNTLEVKVAIEAAPAVFKPDMLVDVTFLAPETTDAAGDVSEQMRLYVPRQLVLSDDAGDFVWVADQSANVARRTPVETAGASNNGFVEITRGLTPASRLIASGSAGLSDGTRIRITGESAGSAEGGVR